jgi:hypothetical protein
MEGVYSNNFWRHLCEVHGLFSATQDGIKSWDRENTPSNSTGMVACLGLWIVRRSRSREDTRRQLLCCMLPGIQLLMVASCSSVHGNLLRGETKHRACGMGSSCEPDWLTVSSCRAFTRPGRVKLSHSRANSICCMPSPAHILEVWISQVLPVDVRASGILQS